MSGVAGDTILGLHTLDLLSRDSNAEVAAIGSYSNAAWMRLYRNNNILDGVIFGVNSNAELFASNIAGTTPATFRTGILQTSNIQLTGYILDAAGNPYSLGGGGSAGDYASYTSYPMYSPAFDGTKTILDNDATPGSRVLFNLTIGAGRWYLNGTLSYTNLDTGIPIDATNWSKIVVYNGNYAQYIAGTATLVQSTPFFSASTSPQQTANFNVFVDALTGLTGATSFVVAVEGTGHQLQFPAGTVVRAIPVQTNTGIGTGTPTTIATSIQVNPVKATFDVVGDTSTFNLITPGNFTIASSNVDVFLNGTKYVYRNSTNKDYDTAYSYDAGSQQTTFTVSLFSPATTGDIVDITVWPNPGTPSLFYQGAKFYQVNSTTSSPWLNLVDTGGGGAPTAAPGVRYAGRRVVIDGDLIVGGSIWGGSNTSGFVSGAALDISAVANISCNVIGTLNIADYAITPGKLNLVGGNVGIGTTIAVRTLDVRGSMRLDGVIYDSNNTPLWLPSTSLQWAATPSVPTLLVGGTGGSLNFTRRQGAYRWIGDDIAVSVNIAASVATAPTEGAAVDYLLTLPYPVDLSLYTSPTIVGELWLSTVAGGASNLFKAYARTSAADANSVVLRAAAGATDESLGALVADTGLTLQGIVQYSTTSINQTLAAPAFYTPAQVSQDQNGQIGIGLGGTAPRAALDVMSSNGGPSPALVVDGRGTGDIFQARSNGVASVVINNVGQLAVGTDAPQAGIHFAPTTFLTPGFLLDQRGGGSILDLRDQGVSKVVVDGAGNVGIGTSAPAATLDVRGNVGIGTTYIRDALDVIGNIRLSGTIISGRACYFNVRKSANINQGDSTVIIWDDKSTDSHNSFNTTTGEYTVPITGAYYLHAFLTTDYGQSSIAYYGLGLQQNLLQVASTFVGHINNHYSHINLSVIRFCNAGDTIRVAYYRNAAITHQGGERNAFMGFLIA